RGLFQSMVQHLQPGRREEIDDGFFCASDAVYRRDLQTAQPRLSILLHLCRQIALVDRAAVPPPSCPWFGLLSDRRPGEKSGGVLAAGLCDEERKRRRQRDDQLEKARHQFSSLSPRHKYHNPLSDSPLAYSRGTIPRRHKFPPFRPAGLRKSSRKGVKMSISTTSSSSMVAPCQHQEGKWSTSPACAIRSSFPMTKRTRPRSTSVICSCGWSCAGVTMFGSKRRRQTINRSPTIIRRLTPPPRSSTGTLSQSQ